MDDGERIEDEGMGWEEGRKRGAQMRATMRSGIAEQGTREHEGRTQAGTAGRTKDNRRHSESYSEQSGRVGVRGVITRSVYGGIDEQTNETIDARCAAFRNGDVRTRRRREVSNNKNVERGESKHVRNVKRGRAVR